MLRRRKILLALTIAIVVGSLTSTICYALHLRSAGLRERVAADLSRRMGLDIEMRSVTPLSFSSRRFDDITVRLPQQGTELARIGAAVWRMEPNDSAETYVLDLRDGWLLVGAGHWAPDDYQRLLQSGFGHDFTALNLAEVNIQHIDFRWRHADFALTAPAANGAIYFDEDGTGHARLTAYRLNQATVDEPIHVSVRFTPGKGMTFQRAEVRMGDIPLEALGLGTLLGGPVSAGTFSGWIAYRDTAPSLWSMEVGGSLSGARLEELTTQLIGGPFSGLVDVTIDKAVFAPGPKQRTRLESLRFGGRLLDLRLAQFAPLFREPELNGRIDLTVHQADYDRPDLKYLRLSGKAAEVSLEALTSMLGYGVITGRLKVQINALAIVDNALQFADVDLLALPPEDGLAFIEKDALASVGREVFGLNLEPILPERVEYVQLGVKLLLDREGLRVRGSHGPGNRTILTVKLLGRPVGILKQPDRIYPVEDLVALVRSHLRDYEVDELIHWWARRHVRDDQ